MVGVKDFQFDLNDVFSEKQLSTIVKSSVGDDGKVIKSNVRSASDGLLGFLGDHLKITLQVEVESQVKTLQLFVKQLPVNNKPKADFIESQHYFKRERLIYQLFEEFEDIGGPNPWSVKANIYTDSLLVLPDLDVQGYRSRHYLDYFDLPHAMVATTSIARFHAAFANYETKELLKSKNYNFYKEHEVILDEPTFKDCPWLRTAAKLTADIVKTFSTVYMSLPQLEDKLVKLFIDACSSLTVEDGLNVLIHKDLWANNILFKYEGLTSVGAIIIDYQCMRYTAPAFDVMTFLYLTTSKSFRQQHEREIIEHYYAVFSKYLNGNTKLRLKEIGYSKEEYLKNCEASRLYGIFEAIGIGPYTLLDPKTAASIYDDPETFEKHSFEDRSTPIINYAKKCEVFRERMLELSEEFIERYALGL